MHLNVREIQAPDLVRILDYWLSADADYLRGMGADPAKLPERAAWHDMLGQQLQQNYPEKQSYCLIWEIDGQAMGHNNVNKIIFGEEAHLHLHFWQSGLRRQGSGTELVKMGLPYFFNNLNLKKIVCEPYALNPAPNRVLEKAGFQCVREYVTTPGFINFEQPVKRWEMSLERAAELGLLN